MLTLFSPWARVCSIPRILQDVLGDRVNVVLLVLARTHRDEQVEVADRFAAAAERACGGDGLDAIRRLP